jgi:hypothetical protein
MSTEAEIRSEIETMDRREADAMLRADISALESIWDEKLIAYSSAKLFAGKRDLLDYIKKGGLRLKSHSRRTLEIVFDGNEAISIGLENSEMEVAGAGTRLRCSYMNVWTRRADGWKLRARYVGEVSGTTAASSPKK